MCDSPAYVLCCLPCCEKEGNLLSRDGQPGFQGYYNPFMSYGAQPHFGPGQWHTNMGGINFGFGFFPPLFGMQFVLATPLRRCYRSLGFENSSVLFYSSLQSTNYGFHPGQPPRTCSSQLSLMPRAHFFRYTSPSGPLTPQEMRDQQLSRMLFVVGILILFIFLLF